jgi:hypothetical protein
MLIPAAAVAGAVLLPSVGAHATVGSDPCKAGTVDQGIENQLGSPAPVKTNQNNPSLGIVTVGAAGKAVAYVDDRNYALGNGIWLYAENTGNATLNRGGDAATYVGTVNEDTDPCDDTGANDLLIF